MRWSVCLAVLLVTACESNADGGDPDTDWAGAQKMPMGNGSLTFGKPQNGGRFSDPAYLPAWAPQYPGSQVMAKSVQRDGDTVVGRTTEFTTYDPFAKIVDFYRASIGAAGLTPTMTTRDSRVAAFILATEKGFQNRIIIQEMSGGTPPKVGIVIGASADR